jgi:hypothetical protein
MMIATSGLPWVSAIVAAVPDPAHEEIAAFSHLEAPDGFLRGLSA